MAGFKDWIEIFAAGKQTDSAGNTRDYTPEELEARVKKYNNQPEEKKHTAPLVIGHPENDKPAKGWIEKLKTDGKKLFARFFDIDKGFIEDVKAGKFKKRSAAFYADGLLRHVGFLGSMPPAVKGLADVKFSQDEQQDFLTYEFFFEEKLNIKNGGVEDMDPSALKIQELEKKLSERTKVISEFTEKEKLERQKAEEETMKRVNGLQKELSEKENQVNEFSEKLEAEKKEKASLLAEIQELRASKRKAEYEKFCEENITKITPAMKPLFIELCEMAHGVGEYEFAEGKKSGLKKLQEFAEMLPEQTVTNEVAAKDKANKKKIVSNEFADVEDMDPDEVELDKKATEYAEKHGVEYAEAVNRVVAEGGI